MDLGQFDAARGIKVTKVGVLRGVDGGTGNHGDRIQFHPARTGLLAKCQWALGHHIVPVHRKLSTMAQAQ